MGSFPETYNDPNRLRSKRRLYSTQRVPIEFLRESWIERATMKRGMKGKVEGKRGNASPQTPRFYKTRYDISLFPLFFVRRFHAILVTR